MSVYIHPTAVVDEGAKIGEGTKVWHFCHIEGTAKVGVGCSIGQNGYVGQHVTIGDGCKLQNNVSVYQGVTLGRGVFCGPSCVFTNDLTPRALFPMKFCEENFPGHPAIVCTHRGGGRRQHRGQRHRGLRPPNRALRHDRCGRGGRLRRAASCPHAGRARPAARLCVYLWGASARRAGVPGMRTALSSRRGRAEGGRIDAVS